MEDGRCKLGLQNRLELAMLMGQGSTLRAAAGARADREVRVRGHMLFAGG